ncbi:MAG TPA: pantoate--beta-alanine ligase, partial [Candidatus Eisenbacteria bacterium]|nr:pantoate--beta-alanine ligase [Candidatus Eisenbacteria bacterium]
MKVIRSLPALERALKSVRRPLGFVPTMGYLHEGHLSLARLAKKENRAVAASIFVNPIQFGPGEDFERYPRDLARDRRLLASAGVDFVFVPAVPTLFPPGFQTAVTVSELSRPLCGASRPTHFRGVATVVAKLLGLVRPDALYLGQKDYQQVRVLEQMVADLGLPVRVRMGPTVREKDGLAMSSRNVYLSPAERRAAPGIHRALREVAARVRAGERGGLALKRLLRQRLAGLEGARVDYAEIVDARTLGGVVKLQARSKVLAAAAVRFGRTRLIDNELIGV